MKKKLQILAPWIVAVCFLAVATAMAVNVYLHPGFRPQLHIVGDIAHPLTVDNLADLAQPLAARIDKQNYRAVPLTDIIALTEPYAEIRRILFIAEDGFSAQISGNSIEASYLTFSAKSGWQAVNPLHPISANATRLTHMVLVVDENETDQALQIISGESTYRITPGALWAGPRLDYPFFEGTAEKDQNGLSYTSTVFTRRVAVSSEQLMLPPQARLLLWTANGQNLFTFSGEGIWQLSGNRIDYLQPETRLCLEDIRLIYIDPPDDYIGELYAYADQILKD